MTQPQQSQQSQQYQSYKQLNRNQPTCQAYKITEDLVDLTKDIDQCPLSALNVKIDEIKLLAKVVSKFAWAELNEWQSLVREQHMKIETLEAKIVEMDRKMNSKPFEEMSDTEKIEYLKGKVLALEKRNME
jgi:hypothetical protein